MNNEQQVTPPDNTENNLLQQINEAIQVQAQLNQKLERRTAGIIRFGLLLLVLLGFGLVFLSWSVKQDVATMTAYMKEVSTDAANMSTAIYQMQSSMGALEGGIGQVVNHTGSISQSFSEPDSSVLVLQTISGSVKLMQADIHGLTQNFNRINYNLGAINNQMKKLNGKLGAMGHDVNRMSSPAKMFPF